MVPRNKERSRIAGLLFYLQQKPRLIGRQRIIMVDSAIPDYRHSGADSEKKGRGLGYFKLVYLVYFLTRLVVFGFGQRDIRMFAYEAHVFYPIMAIGLLSISSLAKQEVLKKFLKFGLIMLFLILAVLVNAKSAYDVLKSQQYSIGRINQWQYTAAEWIKANTEEQADIYNCGTLGFQNYAAKIKWLGVLSQRHFVVEDKEINSTDYAMIDYTDALLLKNQDYVNFLQSYETNFQNLTPIYNKNNIRLYKAAVRQKCG